MKGNKREHLNLKLGWYLIAGSSLIFIPCPGMLAQSNIVPDNTLGNEASVVNPAPDNVSNELISGGAQRGQNLFHSFQEFNVGEGKGAYFVSPNSDIANILSRVTGSNSSEIMGTLGTMGAAQPNLFLINPNGIIFGENASLDVGGSFVATTADGIQFGDRGFFSASEPDVPPLLTVQPSAFFFNQMNGSIQNNSVAPAGLDPTESLEFFGLRVPDGESLLLLGGDVEINSGGIVALDGEINIGAVETGTVELNKVNNNLSLSLTENLLRGNISLTNGAGLLTSGKNGGKIAIAAENIDILANSTVETGILSNLGSMEAQANDIELDATKAIAVDNSFVFNRVSENATGNGGDLSIETGELTISNGGQVGVLTSGAGNTGNLSVRASESIKLDGGETGLFSGLVAQVGQTGTGNVRETNIETKQLEIANGAQIAVVSFGEGNTSNLTVRSSESSTIKGRGNFSSGIFNQISSGAIGNAGDIDLETVSLNIEDSGQINTSTFGVGNAGDVEIKAANSILLNKSSIFSEVVEGAKGNAGNINLSTKFLTISNGSRISSSSFGLGNAGSINIDASEQVVVSDENTRVEADIGSTAMGDIQGGDLTINTKQLLVADGAQIGTTTFGQGDAGNFKVNATESIELRGEDNNDDGNRNQKFPGGLFAQVDLTGEGKGGNLTINTPKLSISDGSKVQVATFGKGDAGELSIIATQIDIFNTPTFSDFTTGVFGSVAIDRFRTEEPPEGNGGNVTIQSEQLKVIDGGKISVTTEGIGDAGILTIIASESVEVRGVDPEVEDGVSFISASVEEQAIGRGGNVNIETGNLSISDRAQVSVSSKGSGIGGNIDIQASDLTLDDNASISAETFSSNGGNIDLRIADLLILDNQSNISSTAGTAQAGGDGGNIDIDTEFIVAFPNGNNDITANAFKGKGGNINLTAQSIFGLAERSSTPPNFTNDIDASSEFGLDGNISINTPDVDPASALENLPTDIVDASRLITRTCLGGGDSEELNEFVVTGRGGLPNNPNEYLPGDATLSADWVSLPDTSGASPTRVSMPNKSIVSQARNHIVEAKGWLVKPDGTVILTAEANSDRHVTSGFIPPACNN